MVNSTPVPLINYKAAVYNVTGFKKGEKLLTII